MKKNFKKYRSYLFFLKFSYFILWKVYSKTWNLYQFLIEAHEFQYWALKYMKIEFMLGFIEARMQYFNLIFRAYVFMVLYNTAGYCTKIYAYIQENNKTNIWLPLPSLTYVDVIYKVHVILLFFYYSRVLIIWPSVIQHSFLSSVLTS